jgi:hypothetical protein
MNIVNKKFQEDLNDLEVTFGYITSIKRNELELEKTHYNDAFIIANGKNQLRSKPVEIKQKHRNNRCLQINRKGFKPSIRRKRSYIQPGDLFWINNINYINKGMCNYGKQITTLINNKIKYFNTKLIIKYFNFGSFIWNLN